MYIHELLSQTKPRKVLSLKEYETLLDMSFSLRQHNIGALLVTDETESLVGIISERDLARAVSIFPEDLAKRRVGEIMTKSVITCGPDDDVVTTLNIMNNKGIRHMPVVVDSKPVSVISIREFEFACRQLQVLALTDELTGLANRRHFVESLEAELSRYNRFSNVFCVAMLDLDKFKLINDTYGHDAGDKVLKSLAQILSTKLRKYDVVGRLGGEEFGIIFPNTALEGAVIACEHVANAIRACEVITDKSAIHFTASFGVTEVNEEARETDLILKQADKALYKAKDTGRDRVVTHKIDHANRELVSSTRGLAQAKVG